MEYGHFDDLSKECAGAWTYYAISQFILGIKSGYSGISIDPCIPSDGEGFTATRIFRGKTMKIRVSNPHGVEHCVKSLRVNVHELSEAFIPAELLRPETEIEVLMG